MVGSVALSFIDYTFTDLNICKGTSRLPITKISFDSVFRNLSQNDVDG